MEWQNKNLVLHLIYLTKEQLRISSWFLYYANISITSAYFVANKLNYHDIR